MCISIDIADNECVFHSRTRRSRSCFLCLEAQSSLFMLQWKVLQYSALAGKVIRRVFVAFVPLKWLPQTPPAVPNAPSAAQDSYLVIYIFYFLPPQLSGMQKSWLLFLAFLYAQHANTPLSSIFVPCLLVQPTVTQPCQNRPNCSSTGAQQAEEGDKEAGFTLVALSNLCWHHCPEEGRRKRPVRLKESRLVLGAPPPAPSI